jgi:hypothetical protein
MGCRWDTIVPAGLIRQGNTLGIAEFVGQYYDQADINAFTDSCAEPRVVVTDVR